MKFKRYWIFKMERFHPSGGMEDFVKSVAEIPSNKAMEKIVNKDDYICTVDIYDSKHNKVVKRLEYNADDDDAFEHADSSDL